MKYFQRFNSSAYYPNQELRDWMSENDVTIHLVKDVGMYGNLDVLYSSPSLTDGKTRIGRAYQSLHGFREVSFSNTDPIEVGA